MPNQITHLYIVHHSHTDIGYTDLQERVIYRHVDYIKSAIDLIKKGYEQQSPDRNFRWNCETYFCVEQFLNQASEQETEDFFDLVRKGNLGVSANYLNFNDLADPSILKERTAEMVALYKQHGIAVKTAMNADINGISMGQRDAYLENGVEFLFTNIHTHHGMYPLYRNQTPYYWENQQGQRLLVFSGEHYNLGNALGLKPNQDINFMTQTMFGSQDFDQGPLAILKQNLDNCVHEYEESGYPYDFIVTSVSGVFSDNAPPNPDILRMVERYNERYGEQIQLEMVSLQELYEKIREKIKDAPVYRGDLNDWWANGIGSTPYVLKHYKEAVKYYHLCGLLDQKTQVSDPKLMRTVQDNLLLYAEHTWGHSSTITNPYDTMVMNLDIRKNSYASKAHEAAAMNLNRITHALGDSLRYYAASDKVTAINPVDQERTSPVEFYVEILPRNHVKVWNEDTGMEMTAQLSSHPRGMLISFVDTFAPREEKHYRYELSNRDPEPAYTRAAYVGAERVRDIVNDYDPLTYTLPYGIENDWFKVTYEIGKGVTSFYNKKEEREMLCDGNAKFFTPIYENTEIRKGVYEERRLIGRNVRGLHAKQYQAQLVDVKTLDAGPVFLTVELCYQLEGTYHSSVILKLYRQLPRIDFKYQVAKTLSEDIESLYLPLALQTQDTETVIQKGGVLMRPGVDQIPGTCMEYYVADNGVVYQGDKGSVLVCTPDTSLLYIGELKHHPVKLCDNAPENNQRDVYSWIMNNTWETNFKMDLSGFDEFCYSVALSDCNSAQESFQEIDAMNYGIVTFISK
ncbi:MAG: hypothetical protein HFE39_07105 [Clostridiales bacterium]|jgi:hypothetical protein|nr:hypothetical protein [Clostridiales bacterium]